MISIRKLDSLTFQDALTLWNEGFHGYFADMTFTLDKYLSRFALDGLSPELSVVAFDGDRPVGFVLNGVKVIHGVKTVWNGGTGVIPEYRNKGVGRDLIQASLEVYRAIGAQRALLEAILQNERAIHLYQKMGYEITDRLAFLDRTGIPEFPQLQNAYSVYKGHPHELGRLPFYNFHAPWQSQWVNVHNATALIATDTSGIPVGYALYKELFNAEGQCTTVILYQCSAQPGHSDTHTILSTLLTEVFSKAGQECRCTTQNLSESNETLIALLHEAGFQVRVEQVHMCRDVNV